MTHPEFTAAFRIVTGTNTRTDPAFLTAVQAAYRSEEYSEYLVKDGESQLSNHVRFVVWVSQTPGGKATLERELRVAESARAEKLDYLAKLKLEMTLLRMELGLEAEMTLKDFRTESLRNELERRELSDVRQAGAR